MRQSATSLMTLTLRGTDSYVFFPKDGITDTLLSQT